MAFAMWSDATFLNLAPSSRQSACLVTCPWPLPKTTKPTVVPFPGSTPGRRNTIFSGATFVVEYPRGRDLPKPMLLKVQSIVMGGVFSCPKQADTTARNTVIVIVL